MVLALFQVVAVFDREGQQVRAQLRAFALDDFPARQIGAQGFGAATDCAQRADEVLLAESGVVQSDLAHGEVLPEVQVVAAGGEAGGGLRAWFSFDALEVVQHGPRPCVSLAVACYSFTQKQCFVDPCKRPGRQVRHVYGGFLFGHSLALLSRAGSIPLRALCFYVSSKKAPPPLKYAL